MAQQRFKLIFFAPPQALPSIKTALFATGAGAYPGPGNYTEVMFTAPGVGQFKPGEGASPAIGQVGQVQEVGEVRCEVLCDGEGFVREAVGALKKVHPYESPAYEVYRVEDF